PVAPGPVHDLGRRVVPQPHRFVAGTTIDGGVRAVVDEDRIPLGAAGDADRRGLADGDRVVAGTAVERAVEAVAALNELVVGRADDGHGRARLHAAVGVAATAGGTRAGADEEGGVAVAADDRVVAGERDDAVVAGAAEDGERRVGAGVDRIVARTTIDRAGAERADEDGIVPGLA